MTYDEIQKTRPSDFARRDLDKFHYRYPMGEVSDISSDRAFHCFSRLVEIFKALNHLKAPLLVKFEVPL